MEQSSFTWGDALVAAGLRGALADLQARTREGFASHAKARETGTPLPDGEPEASVQEFRYARDLLSAQDMETWLARWSLTPREWMDHFRRVLYRRVLPTRFDSTMAVTADLSRVFLVDAICSGALEAFARTLAGHAAAAATVQTPVTPADSRHAADALARLTTEATFPRALAGRADRVAELAAIEARFDQYRSSSVTERAVRDVIETHRLDWIRVSANAVSFAGANAANEAAMCVRYDGLDLRAVADEGHTELQSVNGYLGDLPLEVRDVILGARTGDVIGPLEIDGRWWLFDVRDKSLPSPNDDAIRARAADVVLEQALARESQQRVRWAQPAMSVA